jgi:hypothetical protein
MRSHVTPRGAAQSPEKFPAPARPPAADHVASSRVVEAAPTSENSAARILVDRQGVEWEVYDEAAASMSLAFDWDHAPQTSNPGLIFSSRIDRRRLWPCPADWRSYSDQQLLELMEKARSL